MTLSLSTVDLEPLMRLGMGRPEIAIGLIDGPVLVDHPDLVRENIREVPSRTAGASCFDPSSEACAHDWIRLDQVEKIRS